jgi:hypothetical protein
VLRGSKVGRTSAIRFKAYTQSAETELKGEADGLRKEQAALEQQIAILAPDVKAQKIRAFQAKQTAFQQKVQRASSRSNMASIWPASRSIRRSDRSSRGSCGARRQSAARPMLSSSMGRTVRRHHESSDSAARPEASGGQSAACHPAAGHDAAAATNAQGQ